MHHWEKSTDFQLPRLKFFFNCVILPCPQHKHEFIDSKKKKKKKEEKEEVRIQADFDRV